MRLLCCSALTSKIHSHFRFIMSRSWFDKEMVCKVWNSSLRLVCLLSAYQGWIFLVISALSRFGFVNSFLLLVFSSISNKSTCLLLLRLAFLPWYNLFLPWYNLFLDSLRLSILCSQQNATLKKFAGTYNNLINQ